MNDTRKKIPNLGQSVEFLVPKRTKDSEFNETKRGVFMSKNLQPGKSLKTLVFFVSPSEFYPAIMIRSWRSL